MTLGLILYGIVILLIALCALVVACSAFIAGQLRPVELKPAEKAVVKPADKKAKAEAEKIQRNKKEIEEAQAEMDKAIEDFIARGGMPE